MEAHGRCWSIRLLGIASPTGTETEDTSKCITIDFIRTKLNINTISILDIDCAHRTGRVVDGCQIMLVRFFARDHAKLVVENRRKHKGTMSVIYEDTTWANRRLLNALKCLKRLGSLHSAWLKNGSVWAKKTEDGLKIKMSIHDDIHAIFPPPIVE